MTSPKTFTNEYEYKAAFEDRVATDLEWYFDECKKEFRPRARAKESKESDSRAARALVIALDTRKLEIDLYWRRAAYFWAFVFFAFTAHDNRRRQK